MAQRFTLLYRNNSVTSSQLPRKSAVLLLILLAAIIVLLPYSPAVMPMPQRDSGIFLYTGWRILQGELPYRDAWDHKPPVIYYLDALGLAGGSIWGVWLLELACLFVAGFICFALVRRTFGGLTGAFSTGLLLIGIFPILQGGNLTTEYALPMQIACLWLARNAERDNFRSMRGFAIGILTGMLFLTRPNTIGVSIAIMAYLSLHRLRFGQTRRWAAEMLVLGLGVLAAALPVLVYFSAQGALGEFWEAAFHFNVVYSAVDLRHRLISLGIVLGGLAPSGLVPLAFLGYGIALVWQVFQLQKIPANGRTLTAILLLDLPLEMVLVNLPGYAHPHYLIALLPALTWFAGFVFWILLSQLTWPGSAEWVQMLFTLGALGMFAWASLGNSVQTWRMLRQGVDAELAKTIAQVTTPEESVLVWGVEGGINLSAQRRSPTRYVYLTPLYTEGYTSEERVLEFLDGLLQSPPVMILDVPGDEMPIFEFPVRSMQIEQRLARLRQRYRPAEEINGWRVYR